MPEPIAHPVDEDLDQIRFRVSKKISKDIRRLAHDYGMTVPMYVSLQMNLHVRGVLLDEAERIAMIRSDNA